ncbi:MAG: hypothetical protein GEV03_27045 [Streptosporangiales bacterium]|nr:hypothetical protein [Streptosporangiales bacterium]
MAVVVATDVLLVAVVGSPWVTDWALAGQQDASRIGRYVVSELVFPGWGASDTGIAAWELAWLWDRWRAGTICRIVAFLLLHLWVARRVIRAAGPGLAWRAARLGAWVFGPVVGALAGLATVIPGAFDPSTTAEDRKALRDIAISSLEDGAYWGLAAGAVCWVALAVASQFVRRPPDSSGPDADEDEAEPVLGVIPALLVPASGLVSAGAVAAVLGGPAVVRAGQPPQESMVAELAGLVSYFHWWVADPGVGVPALAYVPPFALAAYLAVFVFLLRPDPHALAGLPAYRAFAKGWHATTWAAIVAAGYTGVLTMVVYAFSGADYPGGSLYRAMVGGALTELPNGAVYTALLGWVPALAVLGTARLLRWTLDWLERTEAEDSEAEDSAPSAG